MAVEMKTKERNLQSNLPLKMKDNTIEGIAHTTCSFFPSFSKGNFQRCLCNSNSSLPNNHAGWNKSAGWKFFQN